MKKIIIIFLTIACNFISTSSFSSPVQAMDLFKICKEALNTINRGPDSKDFSGLWEFGWCTGYILGLDGMQARMVVKLAGRNPTKTENNFFYCLPDNTKTEELMRVIVKYAEDHPNLLHLEADAFAVKALGHFYTCPPNSDKNSTESTKNLIGPLKP